MHGSGSPIIGLDASTGDRLVVQCLLGKTVEVELKCMLPALSWVHLVITHSAGSALAPAWLRLYLNGTQAAATHLRYPKVRMPPQQHHC